MLIDDYVADLGRALAGPAGPKRDLVVEARDSLADAADALEAEGFDRAEAERMAVAEFGEVAEIAPGYQDELTASAGRRLAAVLFLSLPVSVLIWSMIWRIYPDSGAAWEDRPAWYTPIARLLDYLQAGGAVYGGFALVALSRGGRWIRRPRLVTRSLGLAVMILLPLCGLLSSALTAVSGLPSDFDTLAPVMLAELVTSAFWGAQLYGATRCLRLTRTTPATA
ncbi:MULTISPECIES: permease prefix domain 1-containing protein [unclassified Nonomuraea]|uniref:permease prefix domain 1-containing protein n=1 Tax=unclassified Nonomuraea TaxID=2593643 RepID=UPI0033F47032